MNDQVPKDTPLRAFVFKVSHPNLVPTEGVIEVVCPDFTTAVKLIADKLPGVFIHELVMEYDPNKLGHA